MAEQAEVHDPAEANKQWVDAWNRNNPQELDTLTATDAVLYMEGETMKADSIKSKKLFTIERAFLLIK